MNFILQPWQSQCRKNQLGDCGREPALAASRTLASPLSDVADLSRRCVVASPLECSADRRVSRQSIHPHPAGGRPARLARPVVTFHFHSGDIPECRHDHQITIPPAFRPPVSGRSSWSGEAASRTRCPSSGGGPRQSSDGVSHRAPDQCARKGCERVIPFERVAAGFPTSNGLRLLAGRPVSYLPCKSAHRRVAAGPGYRRWCDRGACES